jgi:hypothetical protein
MAQLDPGYQKWNASIEQDSGSFEDLSSSADQHHSTIRA